MCDLIIGNLLKVLSFIELSHIMINKLKPKMVCSADNSDMRCRAVFLTAAKFAINKLHMIYGHTTAECFEEKYPVCDLKLVASSDQKDLLIKYFKLPA